MLLPFALSLTEPTTPEPVHATTPSTEHGPAGTDADLTLVLARVGTGTCTAADADAILDALTTLQRQVNAARAFADEMAGYCSPHGVASLYAQRLTERLDTAAALHSAHT